MSRPRVKPGRAKALVEKSRSNAKTKPTPPSSDSITKATPEETLSELDLVEKLEVVARRVKEVSRETHHSAAIEAHWELGRVLASLRTPRTKDGRGVNTELASLGSIRLARRFGLKPTQIKMAGYLYRAYPSLSARDRVLLMRRADGSPLRLSVITRLCFPMLEKERDDLLVRACQENWSETRVKELLGGRRNNDPQPGQVGGTPRIPTSLSEALERWQRRADESIRYTRTVFRNDLASRLLEATNPTPVSADQFKALRDRVKTVRKSITQELKVLGKIIQHLEKNASAKPRRSDPTSKSDQSKVEPSREKKRLN